jgi:hypothetical protein
MFRRLRYRKWLVAGLGLAALVVPTTALAGNNLGVEQSWRPYVSAAQPHLFDGRNPDTVDAALAVHPKLDPAIVKYLERYGYSLSQIQAMAQPAKVQGSTAARPTLDPAIVKYLQRYGFTQSQIAAMSGGAYQVSDKAPVLTDGRSPDTIDFAVQAHEPVVTVTRSPGFQWDDFGIGLSAALLALIALGLVRLFSNRSTQKPVTSS